MILSVLERLVLLNLLPKEGDFTTLKLVRVAREDLSFNDIENQRLKFKSTGGPDGKGQVNWDMEASKELLRDFTIGEMMTIKIVEALKKLESDKKLTDEQFTLYEKFVEPPPASVTTPPLEEVKPAPGPRLVNPERKESTKPPAKPEVA